MTLSGIDPMPPWWPPRDELAGRCARLQEAMHREGLDGLLCYGNTNLLYLCGTTQAEAVFLPPDGEPLVLGRPPLDRLTDETAWPRVEPMPRGPDLRARLAVHSGRPLTRVGLELDLLPVNRFRRLEREGLAGLSLEDATPLLRSVRSVKSAFEIAHIRTGAIGLDRVYQAVPGILAEGPTELELEARLTAMLRAEGHQGLIRFHGFNQEMYFGHVLSGPNGLLRSKIGSPTGGQGIGPGYGQGAGPKQIETGELVSVDLFGAHGGYIVDQTRVYFTGPAPETVKNAYKGLRALARDLKAAVRPGLTGEDVYEAAFDLAERYGLNPGFMGEGDGRTPFVGHGVGLEPDEWPILGRGQREVLRPGMVVALEPRVFMPEYGVLGLEDTFLVTETGLEYLTVTSRELREVFLHDRSS